VACCPAWLKRIVPPGNTRGEAPARILESTPLDLHQRMSNRHALTTFAPQETEEEARVYQAEFEALHGGDSTRETSDDDGYSADAAARLGIPKESFV